MNILIFPCGSENALDIYFSLRNNIHLEVYGATGKKDHAKFIYPVDKYIEDEKLYLKNENFIEVFNQYLLKYNIDIVIPTHDTISLFFSEFRDKVFAKVMVSDYETSLIAREKIKMYECLKDYDFCVKTYKNKNEVQEFPVFIKPNIGSGAQGTKLLFNINELKKYDLKEGDIICEYLPGEEITVDCFTDRNRKLIYIGPRTRERTQMGIAFHSKNLKVDEVIEKIANKLNKTFNFRGPWFFQLKKDKDNKWKILEFSVRYAGTMALNRNLGVNFALLGIFDLLDKDLEIIKNNFEIELDRRLKACYRINYNYENVYIDLDDTLIIKNKVNDILMRFLYQCLNNGVNLILITKHEKNIEKTLKKYKVPIDIFNEIIHLNEKQEKYEYIKKERSIFIDNYFQERKNVFLKLNIPVFDIDAIEVLIKD